jgi:hypothetical protein
MDPDDCEEETEIAEDGGDARFEEVGRGDTAAGGNVDSSPSSSS